jgi:hypothetical protein
MRLSQGRRVALLVSAIAAPAATVSGQGAPAVPYVLLQPASVRSAGLNGAAVALVGDASAVFANAAGIATIRYVSIEGSYRSVPNGAHIASGAVGWRLGQLDLAAGGRYFELGSNPAALLPGTSAGRAYEAMGTGAVVYRVGLIAVGGGGTYVRRRAGGSATFGISGDLGLAVAIFDIMALGFSVQNLGNNWSDTSSLVMPRTTRLGFTMNYVDPQESFRLLSTVEAQWVQGRPVRGVVGAEAGIVVKGVGLVGRAGYAGRADVLSSANVTLGATVQMTRFSLDYAYLAEDGLSGGRAHLVGARLSL